MDLNAVVHFNLVARHGGFGAASRAAAMSKATLSRHVRALEDSLGGYMDLPGTRPFVTAPALGDLAGPLGSIVLAANAL